MKFCRHFFNKLNKKSLNFPVAKCIQIPSSCKKFSQDDLRSHKYENCLSNDSKSRVVQLKVKPQKNLKQEFKHHFAYKQIARIENLDETAQEMRKIFALDNDSKDYNKLLETLSSPGKCKLLNLSMLFAILEYLLNEIAVIIEKISNTNENVFIIALPVNLFQCITLLLINNLHLIRAFTDDHITHIINILFMLATSDIEKLPIDVNKYKIIRFSVDFEISNLIKNSRLSEQSLNSLVLAINFLKLKCLQVYFENSILALLTHVVIIKNKFDSIQLCQNVLTLCKNTYSDSFILGPQQFIYKNFLFNFYYDSYLQLETILKLSFDTRVQLFIVFSKLGFNIPIEYINQFRSEINIIIQSKFHARFIYHNSDTEEFIEFRKKLIEIYKNKFMTKLHGWMPSNHLFTVNKRQIIVTLFYMAYHKYDCSQLWSTFFNEYLNLFEDYSPSKPNDQVKKPYLNMIDKIQICEIIYVLNIIGPQYKIYEKFIPEVYVDEKSTNFDSKHVYY